MRTSDRLLLGNKAWAQERTSFDPKFFARLAREQHPEVLWIGCSDSRVPANQITDTDAGEMFVHRNIANVVAPNDPNLGSVIQYAVGVLRVRHVIVCGHFGCGGVRAAMGPLPAGALGGWLQRVRSVYEEHRAEIDAADPADRADRLCEWNVRAQLAQLRENPHIQEAFDAGQPLALHGWVYSLKDGIIRELAARVTPSIQPKSL